jgi:hypothetical protein
MIEMELTFVSLQRDGCTVLRCALPCGESQARTGYNSAQTLASCTVQSLEIDVLLLEQHIV